MGLIKGGLFYLLSIILILSFFAGNVFLTLSLSLSYDNVNAHFSKMIKEQTNAEETLKNNINLMQIHCKDNSDYVLESEGYTISIPCSIVEQGPDSVVDEGIKDIITQIYYSENSCSSLFKCVMDSEKTIFSQQTKDFMKRYFYLSLFFSLLIILGMFFITEDKIGLSAAVGFMLIFSALPLLAINYLLPSFEKSLLTAVSLLFSYSYTVFLLSLITGIILIIFGFGIKFAEVGYNLSGLFSKSKIKKESKEKKKG